MFCGTHRSTSSAAWVRGALLLIPFSIAWIPGVPSTGLAQEMPPLRWVEGPGIGSLGDVAIVEIPEAYVFADAENTRTLMELLENPTSGEEIGCMAPASEDESWFVVFSFSEVGYVKDDEKESLDADAMLDAIHEGNRRTNEERRRRGWSTVTLVGWDRPPLYDPITNNLEWSLLGEANGERIVNFNTRLLGRRGVMEVTLLAEPEQLQAVLPRFRRLLEGFSFEVGHRYAEYRRGDKMAEYGLTALVVGGAAAAAVKTKLIARFWKVLVVAGVAVLGFLKKLFGRRGSQPA